MQLTQCEIGTVRLLEKNILFVDIECEKEISAENVFEFKNAAKKLTNGQKMYSIVNYGAYSLPTKEAREICSKHDFSEHILGRAIVVHDMGQMILARHSVKSRKSVVPTKIFSDLQTAKNWVNEINRKALV